VNNVNESVWASNLVKCQRVSPYCTQITYRLTADVPPSEYKYK